MIYEELTPDEALSQGDLIDECPILFCLEAGLPLTEQTYSLMGAPFSINKLRIELETRP